MRACSKQFESSADLTFVNGRSIRSLSTLACQGFAAQIVLGSNPFHELSAYACVCALCQKGPGSTWVPLLRATGAVVKGLISCQEMLFHGLHLPGNTACTWTGAEGRSVLALQDTSLLPTQTWGTCFPSPVAMATVFPAVWLVALAEATACMREDTIFSSLEVKMS